MKWLLKLVFVLAWLIAVRVPGMGQRIPEPYQTKMSEAAAKLKARDYDSAIALYSEALELFPKEPR